MRKKMKNKLIISTALFYFISGAGFLFAQSDYEIVQNFKKRVSQIEQQIRDADSLAELSTVEKNIEKLRADFVANQELLNQSLYPNKFNQTIENLREAYKLRQDDFTQIDVLESEVTVLKVEVDTLSRRNDELTRQFEELETQSSERIEQLEGTVARLNASLKKRDQVVMSMIRDLLPGTYDEGEDLTSQEKQQLLSEAERNNVLYHIKRAVNDNIRFINATELQPDDIEELLERQENFFAIWRNVGPTMVDLYAAKGKNTNELKEIDEAFSR
jgi:DNA repair ATPase RecN